MKREPLLVVVFLGLLACQDVEVYQQACDGGDMLGCNELGVMYGTGEGVTQDLARAATLYQQACDGGEMWGCVNLGAMYGTGEGVTRDRARAIRLYQQACDGGQKWGCTLVLGVPVEYVPPTSP